MSVHIKILFIFVASFVSVSTWGAEIISKTPLSNSNKREGLRHIYPLLTKDNKQIKLVVLLNALQVNDDYSTTEYRLLHSERLIATPGKRLTGYLFKKSIVQSSQKQRLTALCVNAGKRVVLPLINQKAFLKNIMGIRGKFIQGCIPCIGSYLLSPPN